MKLIDFYSIKENSAHCLSSIIGSSFDKDLFHNSEKLSVVRRKLKQGKHVSDLHSYRLLYNVSFLSKISDSAALQQLMAHLSRFDFLSDLSLHIVKPNRWKIIRARFTKTYSWINANETPIFWSNWISVLPSTLLTLIYHYEI